MKVFPHSNPSRIKRASIFCCMCLAAFSLASCKDFFRFLGPALIEVAIYCTQNDCLATVKGSSEEVSMASAVEDYYELINQGKYDKAWNYLTPSFQAKPGGYESYVDWWSSIREVSIIDLKVLEDQDKKVFAEARLNYYRDGDTDFTHLIRLSLIWDVKSKKWVINKSEVLDEKLL